MQDRQNTINGWILFAGVVALGGTLLAGEIFKAEETESCEGGGGYCPPGVVAEGDGPAEPDKPVAFYLATADAAKGENVFKKCAACHNAAPGGANALGPALHGIMGGPIAGHAGFAYSDGLKGVGGAWDWDKMSAWLSNPKKFAPGTKMTFAGLSNPQDRADLMLWLNSQGGKLTVPPPPAADAAVADAEAEGAGAEKAANEPVLTEQQAIKGGQKNIGGEGAPKLTGTDPAAKKN